MNKILLIITVLLVFLLLSGCGGTAPETTTVPDASSATDPQTGEQTTSPVSDSVKFAGGEHEYLIIRGEKATDAEIDAAVLLKSSIKQKLGADLEIHTDLIAPKAGYVDSPYEIVVGSTDRPESEAAEAGLKMLDWSIGTDQEKIVIVGGCPEATVAAVNYFIANVLSRDGTVSRDLILTEHDYPCKALTLNGTDISEYTVVYPKNTSSIYIPAAQYLTDRVGRLCGVKLNIAGSDKAATGHEILIGPCGRGASAGLKTDTVTEYATAADASSVALYAADGFIGGVVRAFTDRFFPEKPDGDLAVNVPAERAVYTVPRTVELSEGATFRVMTSNVLADGTLSSRTSILASIYSGYLPDVIGLQECNETGHSGLKKNISGIYTFCESKIGSTSSTCYTPILFLTDRYDLIESGSSLFDQRWPKTNTKTYAWAVLERKSDKQKFIVINAHWAIILSSYDTQSVFGKTLSNSTDGAKWREDNSRQVLEKYEELKSKYGNIPAFFMGDMNASPTAASVTALETGTLKNGIKLATVFKNTGISSFHSNPGQYPSGGSAIDIIITTSDLVKVLTHRIILTDEGVAASDHCPVYLDVAF